MKFYDVIIIGAGASGLMCAIEAGKRGRSVLLLDSSNKVGKKILMSGGGRCNFTNLFVEPDNFISANPHFCKSALKSYRQWDFIAMVESHGIDYEERKHGQLFCIHSAKDILQMLLSECEQFGVGIKTHTDITAVVENKSCSVEDKEVDGPEGQQARYTLSSNLGKFACQSLVIASGGLSIPTMGASGFGYEVAQQFALKVLPRRAGLVPFMFSGVFQEMFARLSGLSVDVEITVNNSLHSMVSFRENLLFTHRGLSGPAVLQISNYWFPGDEITINLLPDIDLYEHLLQSKRTQPKILLRTLLNHLLPKKLVMELQTLFWFDYAERFLAEFSDAKLLDIAENLQAWQLKPAATEGYRTAEVTLAGVDTDELSSKTMQCKNYPGLFFIGEVVDVTGHLGGYNFQWAWSSGFAAGQYV